MPITLYNEAGDEVETLSTEEIEALKQPQALVTELLQELGAEKPEDLKTVIKDLKQAENPNWREARQKINNLEKVISVLKTQGKTINDEGQIVEDNKGISKEDVIKEAQQTARQELINEKIDDTLGAYSEEDQKVIRHYYNKLSTGEEITLRNVDKLIAEAVRAAGINNTEKNPVKDSLNRVGSSGSTPSSGNKNFADTEAGKNMMSMFGIPSTKKEDKK